jgi:hypothetical protein
MLAALSIVGFYAWWAGRLMDHGGACRKRLTWIATASVIAAAAGMVCDLTGEGIFVFSITDLAIAMVGLTQPFLSNLGFDIAEIIALSLTAGLANTLYTISGIMLMLATPNVPWWIRVLMCITWAAGIAMCNSVYLIAVEGTLVGMIVSNLVLFPTLLVWVAWMALRWRPS